MNRTGKAIRTAVFICAAAYAASGLNAVVSNQSDAPSLARFSLTYELAARLASAQAGGDVAPDDAATVLAGTTNTPGLTNTPDLTVAGLSASPGTLMRDSLSR